MNDKNNDNNQDEIISEAVVINDTEKKEISTIRNESHIFNAQALIAQAIEKNTPIETMEKLLAMRQELKKEAARDMFFDSLSGFQAECPVIEKKTPVYDKTGKLRYKYAPIDDIITQVKPYLLKYGFSFKIETVQDPQTVGAICKVFHKMGHTEQSEFKVPIDATAYMNVAQKVASALTFSKRYAFCDAFGIMTGVGDDDANSTGEPGQTSFNNQKNPDQNRNNRKIDFNNAPEQSKALYSAIMALIREKNNGKDLFTLKEKAENKKKSDSIIGNYENLKSFYQVLNKIAQERRQLKK